jgi:hypothetical protein
MNTLIQVAPDGRVALIIESNMQGKIAIEKVGSGKQVAIFSCLRLTCNLVRKLPVGR